MKKITERGLLYDYTNYEALFKAQSMEPVYKVNFKRKVMKSQVIGGVSIGKKKILNIKRSI